MSAVPVEAMLGGTGTGASSRRGGGIVPFAPDRATRRNFRIVGGLTGASSCAFPLEFFDPTSADMIEFPWPTVFGQGFGFGTLEIADQPGATSRLLDLIKSASGLTWGQIADAMGVDARAIHLWRRGGGISAAREERLQELTALIDSVDAGDPAAVRTELVSIGAGGASVLERLRDGESPRELTLTAPWRARARTELDHNISERTVDGVVDEDYFFLLYLDDTAVSTFADHATDILDDPMATPRDWAAFIDEQFAGMQQPGQVEVGSEEDDDEYDEGGIKPLFSPADLGVSLGIGAMASRRPLHENP